MESSAAELRTSVERMVTEGKTAIDSLRSEVTRFQARLEEAEKAASTDSLTGLRTAPVWRAILSAALQRKLHSAR